MHHPGTTEMGRKPNGQNLSGSEKSSHTAPDPEMVILVILTKTSESLAVDLSRPSQQVLAARLTFRLRALRDAAALDPPSDQFDDCTAQFHPAVYVLAGREALATQKEVFLVR